ncbi:GNAT family N-acetyltransferase [Hamadaea tsunoensis]|uniref:GNAT family N-acetyltransferase n=1 Tax=Hamadaea tsunoensis TaxID=53368 RepID=UPI0004818B33|nr:GCN5 family acetyltransferase [Hamadaea tsunoensis]
MDLSAVISAVERGERVPAGSAYQVVAQAGRHPAVTAFTGVNVIAADVDPDWVAARLPGDDLSAPLNPPFLGELEQRLGLRVNNVDLVLLAEYQPGPPPLHLVEVTGSDHPRVRRAHQYRDDVRVWRTAAETGVLVLGRGLAGRWEIAVEVAPHAQGRGLGRTLALVARHLVPEERPLWAQIAPGNAASVRAFLAAGYEPVGAEALLV